MGETTIRQPHPSQDAGGTLGCPQTHRQILVQKTLEQVGLEVIDISGRVRQLFGVQNSSD